MSFVNLASGDNGKSQSTPLSPRKDEIINCRLAPERNPVEASTAEAKDINQETEAKDECSHQSQNENNLKERIKQCRNIIESLKLELCQEKARLEEDTKATLNIQESKSSGTTSPLDVSYSPNLYSTCVEDKLTCDENLIQYEKQLQRYQNTLNMAHIEKKNAIRKHMMAKAYKLKLLEVENQCNIELLRVKQSLQCLEPLQMIANKWKSNNDDFTYDLNNYELIPRYRELNALSGSDVSSSLDDSEMKKLNETVLSDI